MDEETLAKESRIISQPLSAFHPRCHPARLPLEILVELFLLSLPPLNLAQAPQKRALALVCRSWKAIVDSTPVLWSGISIQDSIFYVRKSLSKSDGHPIDVKGARLDASGTLDPDCDGVCCMFLEEIQSHARRWRHVALQAQCDRKYTPSATALPSLKSLDFYSNDWVPIHGEYLALLKRRHTPCLREVRLHSTQITCWHLISFPPTLLKLEIRGVFNRCPKLHEWLSILAACPHLRVFRLRDALIRDVWDDMVDVAAAVELTNLQELELDNVPVVLARELTKRLGMPWECNVTVRCKFNGSSPSTSFLTPALSHHWSSQCPKQIDRVEIVPSGYWFRLKVLFQRSQISLLLDGAEAIRDALEWFGISTENGNASFHSSIFQAGSATNSNTPVTLKLSGYTSKSNSDPLAKISDFHCITGIEMNHLSTGELTSCFRYLCGPGDPDQRTLARDDCLFKQPEAKKQTTEVWPFPGLHELVVKGMNEDPADMRDLINMMRSRWGDRATAGASGCLKRIAFLDQPSRTAGECCLCESCDDCSVLDALKVFNDGTQLFWNGTLIPKA